jgi:hypothetical protein
MMGIKGAALLLAVTVSGVACARQGSGEPVAQPTCVSTAFFDGTEYVSRHVPVHPVPGEVLGQARVPGCNDTGQAQSPPDEFVNVARLPGAAPSIAVVSADFPEVIYMRADLQDIPPEVMAYFNRPGCEQTDIPITLEGPWLGIIQPDGHTELDLVPPYDLSMLVLHGSSPSYLRAELSIRVEPSLGTPLTHQDVEAALWKPGTLRVVAGCNGKEFVARHVTAFPS